MWLTIMNVLVVQVSTMEILEYIYLLKQCTIFRQETFKRFFVLKNQQLKFYFRLFE